MFPFINCSVFFRSIIEPVRNTNFRQTGDFHLSYATSLDIQNQVLHLESVLKPGLGYSVNYDKLVIAVGARSNTFNVPGVEDHAFFLKVNHAVVIATPTVPVNSCFDNYSSPFAII